MISFIGIILGLALFMIMAYKGVNMVLSALTSACIMLVISGIAPLEGLSTSFLAGLARFVQDYFLLFVLGALLGRLMSDAGTARRIALSVAGLIGHCKTRRNQRLFCLLMVGALYFVLTYVGISGYVVVFTVMPIARDLYQRTDTPWRLYCSAGPMSICGGMVVGSLNINNIYAADACGTGLSAGLRLSIVAVVTFTLVYLLVHFAMLRHLDRTGEGFLPSGSGIQGAALDEGLSEDQLPGLVPSVLSIAAVMVLSAVFGINVNIVLLVGCVLTALVGWKNLRRKLGKSISAGVGSSYAPILNVGATYAIGTTLKSLEGFAVIESALSVLPPLLNGVGLGIITTFVMANPAAAAATFGPKMLVHYLEAGISAENAQRLMTITGFAGMAPHNAGMTNASQVLRVPYADCLKVYLLYTMIPGAAALAVSLLCLTWGIV